MESLWYDTAAGGLLYAPGGLRYGYPSGPCCCGSGSPAPVEVCGGCDWLDTFDVEGVGFANWTCTDCESILNATHPVSYQGTWIDGEGTWEWWASVDDVYATTACSSALADRTIHVLIEEFDELQCLSRVQIRNSASDPNSAFTSGFEIDTGLLTDKANFCSDPLQQFFGTSSFVQCQVTNRPF